MEETASWKNHSFTLLIFGGIIVLCSIFFALGMVVGRTQGRYIAEVAYASKAKEKAPADGSDNFPLNFYKETTTPTPDLGLQPQPPAEVRAEPPAPRTPPPSRESKSTPPPKTAAPPAEKAVTAGEKLLQVYATKDEKQAQQELKRVKSKGFKAMILQGEKNNVKLFRVVVGPYKESEISLRKKDLQAKGYKDAFIAK
jgi:cell division septation protein DedD